MLILGVRRWKIIFERREATPNLTFGTITAPLAPENRHRQPRAPVRFYLYILVLRTCDKDD